MVSRKVVIAAAALGGIAVTAAALSAQASSGLVSFTVTAKDSSTAAPIPGASLTYGTKTQAANASGVATFTNVPAGPLPLSASATGYQPYGPVQFSPATGVAYFVPMVPVGGGVPYAQSLLFVSSVQARTAVQATFKNQNTIAIAAIMYCTVKDTLNQTVSLGQSLPLTVSPGQTVNFSASLSPALVAGGYVFNYWVTDTSNSPVSGQASVSATV